MPVIHRFRGLFRRVRPYVPLLLEFAVTVASLRMASTLLLHQSYFDQYPTFYRWLTTYTVPNEWAWGMLALAAGMFKLVGMGTLFIPRFQQQDIPFILREIGWGISVIFWSFFCLTITVGDFWSLGSNLTLPMLMLSVGGLLMGPAMPEPLDGGE